MNYRSFRVVRCAISIRCLLISALRDHIDLKFHTFDSHLISREILTKSVNKIMYIDRHTDTDRGRQISRARIFVYKQYLPDNENMLFMTKSAVAFLVTDQNWKIYPSFFSYKKRNNLFRLSNISQTKITLNFLRDKQSLAAALHIILFSFFLYISLIYLASNILRQFFLCILCFTGFQANNQCYIHICIFYKMLFLYMYD